MRMRKSKQYIMEKNTNSVLKNTRGNSKQTQVNIHRTRFMMWSHCRRGSERVRYTDYMIEDVYGKKTSAKSIPPSHLLLRRESACI